MKTLAVALAQTCAGRDIGRNLRRLDELISGIRRADLIALPEIFPVRGDEDDYRAAAQSVRGSIVARLAGIARDRRAWVLAGSIIEKAGSRCYNTCVLLDRRGRVAATYRKMHLFEARLENGVHIRESDSYSAGGKPRLVEIEGWRAGLSICYDLRFPELYRRYSAAGAHLLFAPSNFTQNTGKDHWNVLVRARAIENQCFVVAPNQCGLNPATGIRSHGHSIAVGPWGEVLCEAGATETIITAELDPRLLRRTRRRIPALEHRVLDAVAVRRSRAGGIGTPPTLPFAGSSASASVSYRSTGPVG